MLSNDWRGSGPTTVAELIEQLSHYADDLPVYISGYENGLHDVGRLEVRDIIRDYEPNNPNGGPHEWDAGGDEPERCSPGLFIGPGGT